MSPLLPWLDRHRRRIVHETRLLLVLTVLALLGLAALAAKPAHALPPSGTLSGSFTVPAGTASPADVTVALVYPTGSIRQTQTATNTGTYSFTNALPGNYYVYFFDDTAGDNVQPDYYGDGGIDNIQDASLATVTNGNTTTLTSVALHGGATLSGTITDANLSHELSAGVYAQAPINGPDTDPVLSPMTGSVNLTTGTWSISGLPPGTYTLGYENSGKFSSGQPFEITVNVADGSVSYSPADATHVTLTSGGSATVNFSVPALGIITGTASGPQGPLSDDFVELFDSDGQEGPGQDTAGDGSYTFTVLPGSYKVEFASVAAENLAAAWYGGPTLATASVINVGPGATVANISATLSSGGTISGKVVAAQGGTPVGGISVNVLDAQGNYVNRETAYTQADGTYTLPDLPAGNWYVMFSGGLGYDGKFYATEFYGGTVSEFGAQPVTVAGGQTTANINAALLPMSATALGLPTATGAALSGLHNNKVALSFNLACGAGSGYLHTLSIGLPKGFSWNTSKLAGDLSLGSGVVFTDAVSGSNLVVTLASGQPSVAFTVKAGGITVSKAVEKAAGGVTTKPKKHKKPTKHHKKKKHALASTAKAKKHKKKPKPAKPKDTIVSETINLSVSDMTGAVTSLPITINHPH
jgi:hypothetical protein